MSTTIDRPAPAPAPIVEEMQTEPPTQGRAPLRDGHVIAALVVLFVAVVALTWRKWGMPEIDAGAELTTADRIAHGAIPYQDVRYFYGPLGLYALAGAFKLFGASFATAFAFGLLQTGAILAAFFALGRHWLRPATAGLATAFVLAIGFSGTAFNFVLPHTNSATFGILCLLLMLLMLTRERIVLAGVFAGLVGLTRPEFLAVAAGVAVAYLIGTWRAAGRSAALRMLWRVAVPAIAIPVVVFGWFAARAGFSRLITENLWPVDFLHFAGFKTQQNWMPFDAESLFGLLARGTIYGGLLAALVISTVRVRRAQGVARVAALGPLLAVAGAIVVADLALRATGLLGAPRAAIELELRHLVLAESALPALAVGVAAWAFYRWIRGKAPPLGRSWPLDLALVVAAAGLALRAYNAFTAEGSYAPYYAAPAVLVVAILHERLADRRPQARAALLGALGLVAAGVATYSLVGLYRHFDTPVHTPRGTFVTTAAAAPALQSAVDAIVADTRPGDHLLAAPLDGGLYFMSDRLPALYEISVLPGLLYSRDDELGAIARLRADDVRLAVIGARDFSVWGPRTFGVDYDKILGGYLRDHTTARSIAGTLADPAAGTYPSKGFTIMHLAP